MDSLIWTLIIVLAAESSGVTSQNDLPNGQFQSFDPIQMETFKKFLQKSLSPDGTYNRYLLISTGILPDPINPTTQTENSDQMSTEQPLFDFYEHFKYHVEEILASEDKMNDSIYKLLSEIALKDSVIDSSTKSSVLSSDFTSKISLPDSTEGFTQSDWLTNYLADVDIISPDPEQQMAIKNTQYEVEQSEFSQFPETSSDFIETTPKVSPGDVSFTTEYIKFLTDEQSASLITNSEFKEKTTNEEHCTTETVFLENDLSSGTPFTEEYIHFLKESSNSLSSKTTYGTDSDFTADYSTGSVHSSEFSTNNIEESSSSNLEDTYVSQDTSTDYVSLKLWPTREGYEDMTENQKMEFPTTEPQANFASSHTKFEEAKTQSLRVAKEIRQNESERESSSTISVRGTPGIQYPNYDDIPDNEFNCKDKTHIPGFYADMETRCQVFHVCWPGRRESFLCPIGTIFNQAILACDYWYNSNCSVSSAYYDVNTAFKEVDATKSGMTGPMVDTLIKDSKKTSAVPDEVISSSGEISELYEADVHFSEAVAKHELSKIWKFLPIKAKIFIEPQLKLEDIIGKAKLKRSKKGITDEIDKQSKESDPIALEVLKNFLQSLQKNWFDFSRVSVKKVFL